MEWTWIEREGLKYMVVPKWWEQGVVMAFSTRTGGFSRGPYESLNLGLHVDDDSASVLANRNRWAATLGWELSDMVCCQQVHGNQVAVVTAADRGRGTLNHDDSIPGCDGMVCNQPGVALMEFFADCIPVFFFDPITRAVGLAHCGWKGTLQGAAVKTALAMAGAYGCRGQDLKVFIGPGIGLECFEIDEEIKTQVEQVFTFAKQILYPIEKYRYTWDLKLTNRLSLNELGIPERNVVTCDLCTSCEPELFFSYRRDDGVTGRMAAVIGLLEMKVDW